MFIYPIIFNAMETDGKPTLEELRRMTRKPVLTGEFNLTPRVELAIPQRVLPEDADLALRGNAAEAFNEQLEARPELASKRARLRFIKQTLRYDDHKISQFLGITGNQVERYDLRGRRKKEVGRFQERFDGLFALAGILEANLKGFPDSYLDRRIALETPIGKLSEMSVNDAVKGAFINIAVGIALEAVRQKEKTFGYQRDTIFGDEFTS